MERYMSVFSLGHFLTRNLSIANKMLLMSGIFLLPIAYESQSLHEKFKETIDFSQHEIKGVQVVAPIYKAIRIAQRHRLLSQKVLGGSNSDKENLKKEEEEF